MNRVTLSLEATDIDMILGLLDRKIEKVEKKEIDEAQVAYLKQLRSCKGDIVAQIAAAGMDSIAG